MLKRPFPALLSFLIFALSLLPHADAADSYSVNAGASLTITEHSACAVVTNSLAQSIFVPTKSATEWTSFRTNTPPGVTSVACDTTPNAFDFTPNVTGANLSTLTTAANTVTISGINTATSVSVSGTGAQIQINGGSWATSGTITNGQTLNLRLTSSAAFSTAITATVTVGSVSDTWSVTTRAANNCTVASGTTWTVGSNTCTAPSAVNINHGATGASTDSTAPTTGSATYACNDGAATEQSGATCAAASAGTLYCWGTSAVGQVGNGSTAVASVPAAVTMPSGVTAFGPAATGAVHACAAATAGTNAGKVYCWGAGTNGVIGNGGTANVSVPTAATMPSGVTAFGHVAAGQIGSCAIASAGTNAGKVYCWGTGAAGQIGNGGTANVSVPTAATMPSGVTAFSSVSTGATVCAIASAGTNAGKVYCWGAGTGGQIGNGGTTNVSVPTAATMPSGVTAFGSVTTGQGTVCAIASAGSNAGKVYCWGGGAAGGIGNGGTANVTVPTAATMPSGVTGFGTIKANTPILGLTHFCAIASTGTNAGKLYCWGPNGSYQLGDGTTTQRNVPTLVTNPSGVTAYSAVAPGGTIWLGSGDTNRYATCALASAGSNAGKVYCWGSELSYNQFGEGAGDHTASATKYQTVMPSGRTSFTDVSMGTNFTCGRAQ